MIIDCDGCMARGPACGDCVVTVLLGMPGMRPELDDAETAAIAVLAGSGLVPPLRLVPGGEELDGAGHGPPDGAAGAREAGTDPRPAYDGPHGPGATRAG